jgi:hypothetical protein
MRVPMSVAPFASGAAVASARAVRPVSESRPPISAPSVSMIRVFAAAIASGVRRSYASAHAYSTSLC